MNEVRVNGMLIPAAAIAAEARHYGDGPDAELEAARALVVRELLLQRARALGLMPDADAAGEEAEDAAIEALLAREVPLPQADEAACRRCFEAHPERFAGGEIVEAAHILFAVTPATPVQALRARAGQVLAELLADPAPFAERARELSNCPSGQHGGNLGQLHRGESVREFEEAVFGSQALGVLPELVATRFGFHIVHVARRIPARVPPFEAVRPRVAAWLAEQVRRTAYSQYLRLLAGEARVDGIDLPAADSPLLR